MNKKTAIACIALAAAGIMFGLLNRAGAAAEVPPAAFEYLTLRWDGRDHTHVIRPNGTVESLGRKLGGIKKPDNTDDRSFYMNLAMNALAREGFELVAMTPDDYVFKRPASK